MFCTLRTLLLLLVALPSIVLAHIALWDPGMYGWDPNNPNQYLPVDPLMNLPMSQWWFHGYINTPPPAGAYMTLPAGGTYHGQVACNKDFTSYGLNENGTEWACDSIGPLHTADAYGSPNPTDVKGCGLAIAYESDVTKIQPEDFAMISVNYTCPWKKDVDLQIPADLPACPEGGCHCMWGWVHSADSGSEQMYFLGYRCNVTGTTATQAIPKPNTANKCNYPTDTSNCTVGAKQPHYWFQAEGNNNPQGTYDPPFYNGAFGFMDGAQTDLFAAAGGSPGAVAPSTNASSSSAIASSGASASPAAVLGSLSSSSQSLTASPTSITPSVIIAAAPSSSQSSSVTTTSTSASSSTTSSTSNACKRRRRDLSNLSTAEGHERHLKRQARRSAKRAA